MCMKKYVITVSEPWNFSGVNGQNIIIGSIIRKVNDECIIFKSDEIQHFQEESGYLYVLFPRIKNITFLRLNKGEDIYINGGIILDIESNYEEMKEKELEYNSKFVFIGSIQCK